MHKSKGIINYIHADLWGPAKTPTQGGNLYFLSFIDDYSRKFWIYLLINKLDALNKFVVQKQLVETQMGKIVKVLRTDNGLEFCNKEFDKFFLVR